MKYAIRLVSVVLPNPALYEGQPMSADAQQAPVTQTPVAEQATKQVAKAREAKGTTYLAPDGSLLRLSRYETIDFEFYAHENPGRPVPDEPYPIYDYFSPRGGAASGITALPEGSVKIVIPTPERPVPGSMFVTPDGTMYRLRDYRTDLHAEPFTGEATIPTYKVNHPNGMSSTADELPEGARLVWVP